MYVCVSGSCEPFYVCRLGLFMTFALASGSMTEFWRAVCFELAST